MKANVKKILFLTLAAALLVIGVPVSGSAESIIINFEVGAAGNPYLKAIPDTNGKWQIGFGSTWNYDLNRWVKPGDTVTKDQALKYMRNEISEKESLIKKLVKVPLTKNQLDSLVSLTYNIGTGAFTNSTLLRYLNEGKPPAVVADQFYRWVYAEGKVLQGLVNRRRKEKALFLS